MKFTLFLLLAAAALAQDYTPIEPPLHGWSAASWGMTIPQVRAAFPAAAPLPRPEKDLGAVGVLRAAPVDLGPIRASATFEFAQDADRLVAVRLEADPHLPYGSTFQRLRQALVEKYGRPTSEDNVAKYNTFGSRITDHTVQWNLKLTVIRLTWYDAGEFGFVAARYSERKADASL